MSVSPVDVRRRLAYIRYLHHLGVEQTRLPQPQSSTSVLMFHDAVEAFLLLAAEHLGASSTFQFEKAWETFRKHGAGVELPVEPGMKRLNRVRVALKHHGAHPDQPTIEQLRTDTTTFLDTGTTVVFDLDYATVTMTDVISQDSVRELARKAETASASGDHIGAMVALTDAIDALFDPRSAETVDGRRSPFQLGPTIRWPLGKDKIQRVLNPTALGSPVRSRDDQFLAEQIVTVREIVEELQAAARLTALGIDFAAYQRFRLLTPHAIGYYGGRREYRAPVGYAPSAEDVAFCHQFVVTAALRLAAAEAHLTEPPWIASAEGQRPVWETIAKTQS